MAESENQVERRVKSFADTEMRVVRAADGKPSAIEGYAAVFEQWSGDLGWFREKIAKGAFANALKTSDIRCLFNHDSNFILGRAKSGTLTLKEDGKGLWFHCSLPDAQDARDLAARIERGDIDGCSFQFTTERDAWVYSEDGKSPDDRTIVEIRELFDVGPVVFPAYPQTSIAARDKALGLDVARRSRDAAKPTAPPAETPAPEVRETPAETPATPPVSATPLLDAAKAKAAAAATQHTAEVQRQLNERINRQREADATQ